MQFENRFEVDAPIDRVWKTLLDVERVAPTVPGASVLERTGDDAYKVAIKVKVGPMSMTYRGDVEIVERDEAAYRAVMRARAKESRGQGTADADVTMVLRAAESRTAAVITTDVDLSGKVATMGQGVLQDVSGRLVETFAANLAAMLEGREEPAAEEPAKAKAAKEPAKAKKAAKGRAAAKPKAAKAAEPSTDGAEAAAPAEEAVPAEPERAAEPARAAEPERAAEPPRPEEAPRAAEPPPFQREDALDLGSVGGAMLADRLRDPRRLAILLAIAVLIGWLLGRRSRR